MTVPVLREHRVALVGRLRSFGSAPALTWVGRSGLETMSYAVLAARVDERRRALGETPRLVVLEAGNDVESVVTLLACLGGGHPVVCAPAPAPARAGTSGGQWWEVWNPDVVARGAELEARRPGSAHDVHPDLALLLSTSGSTGSPKLVRLSGHNLDCNAEQIVDALGITADDVAATTLPLQYCYGLSVLLSHLSVGAGVLLTDLSVVDECFWEAFRAAGATTLAGVPYTFDLLDAVGFADLELPSLRLLTQAGGRMDPTTVRRFAELGEERGFELSVMYGQTEATARMATLPAHLARTHPSTVGVAVRGGHVALAPVEGAAPGVGELTYSGGNVMMGYAQSPADLARGPEVSTLHTGDLARFTADGLIEIVGRRSRLAKVCGLRIDLDRVEADLAADGCAGYVMDGGDRLVIALVDAAEGADDVAARVRRDVSERYAVPRASVVVTGLGPSGEVPRTPSGKVDRPALASRLVGGREGAGEATTVTAEDLRLLYADLLDRSDATVDDTFVSLRGDSLSYVEMSVRLEGLLGTLPTSWHVRTLTDLAATARTEHARAGRGDGSDRGNGGNRGTRWVPAWLRTRVLETSVVLRALAIALIVLTHAGIVEVRGGAHVLLAVAGYAFARFQLSSVDRPGRVAHVLESVTRIALPSAVWIGLLVLIDERYSWWNPVLLTSVAGGDVDPQWRYWFVEALVHVLAGLAVLLCVPAFDALERARPFAVPFALAVLGLLFRFGIIEVGTHHVNGRPAVVMWLFALGWAAARAGAPWQRWLLTAYVAGVVPGFFGDPARELAVAAGLLVLLWVPSLRVPAFVVPALVPLASASLFIYLVQWEVMGRVGYSLLGSVVAVLAGWVAWRGSAPLVEPAAREVGRQASRVLSNSSRTWSGSAGS